MSDASDALRNRDVPYDPYHKLLGISKQNQPPTLYRLLGLDTFKSDVDVIDGAANKQMTYLQGCCNGEHAASAERLLNEVADARLHLLDPQSKASYDSQLQVLLSQTVSQPLAELSSQNPSASSPTPAATSPQLQATPIPEIRVRGADRRTVRRGRSKMPIWILGSLLSFGLIVGVMWWTGFLELGQEQ